MAHLCLCSFGLISLRHTTRWGWAEESAPETLVSDASASADFGLAGAESGSSSRGGPAPGWGRMRLEELCAEQNLDVRTVVTSLRKKGVRCRASQTLREIAADNGFDRPRDVLDLIQDQ